MLQQPVRTQKVPRRQFNDL